MSFLDGRPPRVIAHRGLALDAPENTLLAFLRALNAGATHLETDIHASADGVAVIAHDPDLSRVAGRDVQVAQLTLSELRRIDLGHGQSFCSLAEALEAFPAARFNIDVKDARAAASAVEAIRAARATDRVLITSFAADRRKAVAAQLPGVACSPAVSEFLPVIAGAKLGLSALVRRSLAPFAAVQVPERRGPLRIVTPRTVERIHAAGAEVHVWTVNEPGDMIRLLDAGVDGIVTDRCDVLRRVVDARR
ncbi:glycerophosphodiester phosphodiesterase family protein [Leifsonia shinshuensis]|uniref:glycerophosphodiester phosphodiesterase family protein n=1 Tax=Leifsonia shinshuensis TaxID=150026 RepID=UPI002861DFCD|nr:glycerophosphodiester phosphodiesterase family protein [Leifsonia shinshuensis]MDR6970593.1 glycerophosphoryl diester phosphodiesterase [Leifsonia shinshuensis]